MKKKKLYVIDGHAMCYRAYYAFIKNPLINSDGQNTSAIFGFARMLYKLIEEQNPDYLIVAFDPPKKSFRFDMYTEYKANRQKMPDDLKLQIEEIKNMVEMLGIKRVEEENYEADDVLGTIAKKYGSKDVEVILVTGDKDAYQLLDKNVKIYANKKGISDYEIYDEKNIKDKIGIKPEHIIDYMALTGDTSDNIPGVKGIGEKTALKLIETYGTLENIYNNIDNITGKQKELLIQGKDMAFLSRELVTIKTDIPINFDLSKWDAPDIKSKKVRDYFKKLEMNSIVNDFFEKIDEGEYTVKTDKNNYEIIRTEQGLKNLIEQIKKSGIVSMDTETTSVFPVDADLIGMSFSIKEKEGWYIPLISKGLFTLDYLDPHISLNLLKPILEDPSIKKIGQNIKYDLIVLKNAGIELAGIYFDTMIASYLINPNERRHNMDDLALKYLNYKTITFKELIGTGKNSVPLTEVPLETIAEYAIEDADIVYRLYQIFKKSLVENELDNLFYEIEMPLLPILAEMEYTGVKIDVDYFKKLGVQNEKMLEEVEGKIYKEAGQKFNINSTRELASILFDKMGLKPKRKTKTGFSTDINVLESLQGSHDIIKHLISYRTLSKLKNTYIDSLPKLISKRTGRIHTSYNQTVVATGRLSSSDPNLQNIPIRDEFGKNIRKGFISDKDFIIMAADYSQIELRLAAHLSADSNMLKAFKEGIDIHNLTASNVFAVPIKNITPDMRRQAKIINFATIYGVSPYGLSQQAEIGMKEAAEFIKIYFETYPGFKEYIDKTVVFVKEHGYVKTLMGRKRIIPEIDSKVSFRREGAVRIAINTPIQGTSADMIKIAMIHICKEFKNENLRTRMIMQVHDELVFEVHSEERERVEDIVRRNMENALPLSVPIVVDIGWGKNWDEAH